MKFDNFDVVSPALFPDEHWNEAEAFGAMTWLWLKSEEHCHTPIQEMAARTLPVLKNGQFALFSQNGQPVAYIAWASFSPEAETRYLQSDQGLLSNQDWQSGDRKWFINWFAPLGNTTAVRQIAKQYLFANDCLRSLYHRGNDKGLRIMLFKGGYVSLKAKQQWESDHPVTYPPQA